MTEGPIGTGVAAILLAAGSSRRFGADNKLLAEIDGVPLVVRAARALTSSRARDVIVVTGHEVERITAVLTGLPVRFVFNGHHSDGIGTSVAAGIAAVNPEDAGALVVQADMPNLSPELADRLIAQFQAERGEAIVVPVDRQGAQGNPVLWPRPCFAELARLSGDRGAKALLQRAEFRIVQLAVEQPQAFLDIDTVAELAAARAGSAQRA